MSVEYGPQQLIRRNAGAELIGNFYDTMWHDAILLSILVYVISDIEHFDRAQHQQILLHFLGLQTGECRDLG